MKKNAKKNVMRVMVDVQGLTDKKSSKLMGQWQHHFERMLGKSWIILVTPTTFGVETLIVH
jgi:hypothetical protein